MDREILNKFLGKKICFLTDAGVTTKWSSGVLADIFSDCVLINFKGQEQFYSLESIKGIKEDKREGEQ